jgi:flavin reductase (DIM6/NTAB) family NADH-FMN oxidoreductase RutF
VTPTRSFDLSALPEWEALRLLSAFVAPRPLALVSTLGADGRLNLAPFSSILPFSARPPLVGVGIHAAADGQPKETLRNIETTGEFVVSLVSPDLLQTAVALAQAEGRARMALVAEVAVLPSERVRPARVAGAPAWLECRLHECLRPSATRLTLVVGEILRAHACAAWLEGSRQEAAWVGHVTALEPARHTFAVGGRLIEVVAAPPRTARSS